MWLEDDRGKWRTTLEERAHRHDRCGTFDWEWPDDRETDPWEADAHLCPACYLLDEKLDKLRDSPGSVRGMSVRLFRNREV